jgi:hypothetical protein
MPETQITAYYQFLSDIPLPALEHAIARAVQECEGNFVPSVATLRRFSAEVQWGSMPAWGEEWERVADCCRKFGQMRWEDASKYLGPFTWRIVRQIGWSAVCSSELPNVQMSQFKELYTAAVEMELKRRCLSEELRPARSQEFLTTQPIRRIGAGTNGHRN